MLILFTIGVPVGIAFYFGLRGGKDRPRTRKAFAVGSAWVIGWTLATVVLWQGVWIFAVGGQGANSTIFIALYWAAISSVIWLPVLMITYVISAQRAIRREESEK